MGHLITAGCIHYRATGRESLLNPARKAADYLYTVFKPRPSELAHFCFNPSQIMGLVELYRLTGEAKHLDLAGIFVDMRGSRPGGTDQNQQRVPRRQETGAEGHSVKPDGRVELTLPMDVPPVEAHPKAEELRNQVAVMRGPLLYALESPDPPGDVRVSEVALPPDISFTPVPGGQSLGGIAVLEGQATLRREGDWTGTLYRTVRRPAAERIRLKLIPYYAWGIRRVIYMTMWKPLSW